MSNVRSKAEKKRGIPWTDHQKGLSTRSRLKSLINLNEEYDPLVDERNYTRLPEDLEGTYITELLSQFRARPVRARFVSLKPGTEVRPHIDYSPKYALKVHIPVYTNDKAILGFEGHGEHHLRSGKATIVNSAIKHWAANRGDEERIHLVISLDGQEDYTHVLATTS